MVDESWSGLCILIGIALTLLSVLGAVLACMAVKRWGRKAVYSIAAAGVVLLLGVIYLGYKVGDWGDRILAERVTASGIKLVILQTYNGNFFEPYTTSFYFQRPGGPWKWFYMDHEDLRWWSGKIELSEGQSAATVLNGREPVAAFNWAEETFKRPDKTTVHGAQEEMPEGWAPRSLLR